MASCLKGTPHPQYAISGAKWYQVKLRTYNLDNGSKINDTIYQQSAFDTTGDFAQFFNTGQCHIGSGSYHPFYPSGALGATPHSGGVIDWNFSKVGSVYIIGSGIMFNSDTAYLKADTLRIHQVCGEPPLYYITDAYYTRVSS
jgi:hypothetical protein